LETSSTAEARAPTLTGREEDSSIARGHRHLYYLPQLEPGRLELTALLLQVPIGTSLRQEELDALMSVERIVLGSNERYLLTVVPEQVNENVLVPASQRWRSATPFLAPHQHRRGRAVTVPELQLASCLKESCGMAPINTRLARAPWGAGVRTPVRAHNYAANPSGARRALSWKLTRRLAHWFTVDFEKPVVLAVPVGADAHFGLGQFEPIEEE
jgi:CRISPR-associated protein Csb2